MGNKFSSYTLSDSKKSSLCKGLRFNLPPKNTDYGEFLVQFELFIVISCSLIYHLRNVISLKINLRMFSFPL